MSPWALLATGIVCVAFLPLLVVGIGAVVVAGDADTAAGRDEVGERA